MRTKIRIISEKFGNNRVLFPFLPEIVLFRVSAAQEAVELADEEHRGGAGYDEKPVGEA